MLDLYFWTTPNGYKVTILLEELGLQYNVVPVHIGKGEQFNPDFLKISPNNKIPALVDHQSPVGKPITLFESGAIMMYLAEISGWRFMPVDLRQRYQVIQWLMFQMGNLGPMLGQAHHFRRYAMSRSPTQSTATPMKQRDSIVCSTSGWAKLNFSPATTLLPIWRSIPGCVPISGKDRTSRHGRTCNAGTTQCALVPVFSEA
jgi:glutathione S-transferase